MHDTTIAPSTHLTISLDYEGRVRDTVIFDQVQGKTVASQGRWVSHSGKMAGGVLINSDANRQDERWVLIADIILVPMVKIPSYRPFMEIFWRTGFKTILNLQILYVSFSFFVISAYDK
jgi:hypothetical protein